MSPQGQGLRATIAAARRRVRADGIWSVVGTAAVFIPLALVVAWAAGRASAWLRPSPAPLVLEIVALAGAVVVAYWLWRRWIAAFDEAQAAAAAEATMGLDAGSVRGVLELGRSVPDGTSAVLFAHEEGLVARRLAGTSPAQLAGEAGVRARRRRRNALLALGGATAFTLLLGFAAPERASAGWRPLLHPVDNLTPPPMPPLSVAPGNARVPRGGALDVKVKAPLRQEVELHWRAPGDVPRKRTIAVTGGAAASRLDGIDAPVTYWVTAPDGARSDSFRITPVDPLLVSDLAVDVVYPAYLGHAADHFDGDVPPLELPVGSRLRIHGRATRLLSAAALVRRDGEARVTLETVEDRFEGAWTPTSGGTYDWKVTDRSGAAASSLPGPIELTLVPDSAPHVDVLAPAVDTLLAPDMKQPIAASAWDDHGLRGAALVSWRVSALGQHDPQLAQTLTLNGTDDHATLETVLDATNRRLLPGDTLHFLVRATDNAGQVGESRLFTLWIPGMDELRQRAEDQAESLVQEMAEVARNAKSLQEDTRDLARKTTSAGARGSSRGGTPGQSSRTAQNSEPRAPSYDRAEQARQLLDRQDGMVKKLEELKQRTADLERAMQAAGLQDPELQQRLQEMKKLYDQILTPELRQKLQQLQQALSQMDQEKMKQALEALSQQQDQLRKQVEQSLEMLRRAAAEQQMNSLSQQAKELSTQQKALADAMRDKAQTPQGQQKAQEQQRLAQRADSLAKAIDQMRQQLAQQGEQQAAQRTADAQKQAEAAQKAMQDAAKQAQQQSPQQAAQQGDTAADKLQQAAQQLDDTRKQMADAWKQEVQQAVQQATNEALSLAQREAALAQKMRDAQQDPNQQQPLTPPQLQPKPGQQSGQQQDPKTGQSLQQQAGQQAGQQSGAKSQTGQKSSEEGSQNGGKSPQQGGQKSGGQQGQGQQGQSPQAQQGGQGQQGQAQAGGSGDLQSLRGEQRALQQSLQQLGKNLSEAGEKSALMDRDVGAALSRALLSMQQTLQGLEQAQSSGDAPVQQADQTVDALNRLALQLATNGQQIGQSQSGTGVQEQLEKLAELAKKQGGLNGQTSSLLPMDLAPSAMSQQLNQLAAQQSDIARKLGGMANKGGQDDALGQIDALAKEADQIARQMSGGRLTPELLANQERLFHRLLDAGRTLERDETSNERVAEPPGDVGARLGKALDPALLKSGFRYAVPTEAELQALPPAYRRLILEYFDRLNREAAKTAARPAPAAGNP